MKRIKKLVLSGSLLSILLFLSGCMRTDGSGNPTGFIYNYLVVPTQQLIIYLADLFNGSYGLAIIAITLVVRLLILPANLKQSKGSIVQQEKMAVVKPEMEEIQKRQKAAQTPQEKAQAQQDLMSLYKENNISMMGGIGCLPLLIQLPIFTAMFQAISLSPEIASSTFLGFSLGERNIPLAIAAGAVYFLQSHVSMIGMPDAQKKQMRTMMYMSPIMILFFTFNSPAGLGLYWLAGGIFAVFQTLLTNLYFKPRIKAEVEKEMANRPQKTRIRKEVSPVEENEPPKQLSENGNRQVNRRNAGKQQERRRNN